MCVNVCLYSACVYFLFFTFCPFVCYVLIVLTVSNLCIFCKPHQILKMAEGAQELT